MSPSLKFLMAALLCVAALGCESPAGQPPASANGRYLFSHDSRDVFITDTATGTVWYRSLAPRDDKWNAMGSPISPTTKP